jgi:hypothetical protein
MKIIFSLLVFLSFFESCRTFKIEDFNGKVYIGTKGNVFNVTLKLFNDSLFIIYDDLNVAKGIWRINQKNIELKSFPVKKDIPMDGFGYFFKEINGTIYIRNKNKLNYNEIFLVLKKDDSK